MVFREVKPSFLAASCCRELVVKGAAGFLRRSLFLMDWTESCCFCSYSLSLFSKFLFKYIRRKFFNRNTCLAGKFLYLSSNATTNCRRYKYRIQRLTAFKSLNDFVSAL